MSRTLAPAVSPAWLARAAGQIALHSQRSYRTTFPLPQRASPHIPASPRLPFRSVGPPYTSAFHQTSRPPLKPRSASDFSRQRLLPLAFPPQSGLPSQTFPAAPSPTL